MVCQFFLHVVCWTLFDVHSRHEHIYGKISKNIIRSTEFRAARHDKSLLVLPVILCTLSMLSHPRLDIFTTPNPIKTLVIDEASQIAIGDYIPPLRSYPTITKICMIGDDKQCKFFWPLFTTFLWLTVPLPVPPYGADEDDTIQSVFEVTHLRDSAVFLSIQCRCAYFVEVKCFKSNKLVQTACHLSLERLFQMLCMKANSSPTLTTQFHLLKQVAGLSTVLKTPGRCSMRPVGMSVLPYFAYYFWLKIKNQNPVERAAVLKIAEKLQAENKEYCIITPYDAQRSFLENDLKSSGLIWEDKCFNVDSFQGESLLSLYVGNFWLTYTCRK